MAAATAPDAATALAGGSFGYVVTATTSTEPVLPEDVANHRDGNFFVAGIGSFRPHMAELPAGLVRRARLCCADTPHAVTEAGDLDPARTGIDPTAVLALADAVARARAGE